MIDHAAVILDLETKRDAINTTISLLRELYGMSAINGHKEPLPAKPAKRTYRYKTVPVEPPVDPDTGRQSRVQTAILQVLKGHPMTSIETFEELKKTGVKTTSGSVYQTLRLLFSKGLLTKGENDIGQVTWNLV